MKKCCLFGFLCLFFISAWSQTYTNPVIVPGKFNNTNINSLADPHVLQDSDGTYYLYVTGNGYPCFSSKDLVNWQYEKNVFTGTNRKWATNGFWAPEVIKIGSKYYLHYTAGRDDKIKHIGVAVADKPTGPFVDISDQPFIDHGEKGTIDSHVFIDDDGRTYMYYSNAMSTNPIPELGGKKRSEIWVVEIEPDFSGLRSEPQMLIYPQQSWEFDPSSNSYWNEGAVIIKHENTYYMLFSSNCYCAANYAVGYAYSSSPFGPFTKSTYNPILSNSGVSHAVSGPGHNSVVKATADNEWYIIYHSHVHVGNLNSTNNGIRQINVDKLTIHPFNYITVDGPTITPQPYPSLPTGLKGNHFQQLRVYPTLVEDSFNINHAIHNTDAFVMLTSITGQNTRFPVQTNADISIECLPAGCYQLMLIDGMQQYHSRIIKL
jgi:beta-xylosidase